MPISLFDQLWNSFRQATDTIGYVNEQTIVVGGRTIRLCFAGEGLVSDFMPAFQHILAGSTHDILSLTVYLCDCKSTGIAMPNLCRQQSNDPFNGMLTYNNGATHATQNIQSNCLSYVDTGEGVAFFYARDSAVLPDYEKGSPLRMILHWWSEHHGMSLAHSAAVGLNGCGVVLAGSGGSGKSTTALTALCNGFQYAGDDYILFSSEPELKIHSLYSTAKMHSHDLKNSSALTPFVRNWSELPREKALLDLFAGFPEMIVPELHCSAILLPKITGDVHSEIFPASSARALAAIGPSTLLQMPGSGKSTFADLARVVQKLPAYCFCLGTDAQHLLGTLSGFIATLPQTGNCRRVDG